MNRDNDSGVRLKNPRVFPMPEEHSPEQLLADYFNWESELVWPAAIEATLARRICEAAVPAAGAVPILPVPDNLLARPSGLLLEWLISQRFRHVSQLRNSLIKALQRFAPPQRVLWARGWALWPETPVVPDPPDELLMTLRSTPSATGWAALPLYARGNVELAREAAVLWERAARTDLDDVPLVEALLSIHDEEILQESALKALRRLALHYSHDSAVMLRLCLAAFGALRDDVALFVVELGLPFADGDVRWRLQEARLSALAARGAHDPRAGEAALNSYRESWQEGAPTLRDPGDLLRALDDLEDDGSFRALRRKLVENADRTRPEVEIEYRGLVEQQWADVAVRTWSPLQQKPQLYYLFRVTEAVAETIPYCPLDYSALRILIGYWENYRVRQSGREPLARAAQFLLASATQEDTRLLKEALGLDRWNAITFAQRLFLSAESLPSHWLVGAALRRVIESLATDWRKVAEVVTRNQVRVMRLACRSPEEFDFFRLMGELTADEFGRYDRERWCQLWEGLLALPLDYRWLLLVLQRFDNMQSGAIRQGELILDTDVFWEVERQILWRGKYTGEQRLAAAPPAASSRRQRLLEELNQANDVHALWLRLRHIDEEIATWN